MHKEFLLDFVALLYPIWGILLLGIIELVYWVLEDSWVLENIKRFLRAIRSRSKKI